MPADRRTIQFKILKRQGSVNYRDGLVELIWPFGIGHLSVTEIHNIIDQLNRIAAEMRSDADTIVVNKLGKE